VSPRPAAPKGARAAGRAGGRGAARARLLALAVAALALAGCEREMRDMYAQPRLNRDAASPLFPDGRGTRPPPPGSLAYSMGDLALTSGGRRGRDEIAARAAADAASGPPPATRALLERGRDRFAIDCAPCHGLAGDGDGMVVRRGFPAPPSLHVARLREAPARHLFDTITEGHGVMPALADRVTPEDRWAIAAYVRVLQASRAMPVAMLDDAQRAALAAMPAPASVPAAAASGAAP
jgi:mono/diheme cytochrome c family protein